MTAGRDVARAGAIVLVTLAALILGSTGVALAAPPSVTIEAPVNGSSTSNQRPLFSGASSDSEDLVTVEIYAGSSATGTPVQALTPLVPPLLGTWSIEAEAPLAQGRYTAVAEQTNEASETGTSEPVTFTVDTTPPSVTIDAVPSPTNDPTPTLGGDAQVEEGSEEAVTVTIYKGNTTGGTTVAGPHTLATSGGVWQYTSPHLADGTYTAQATRRDEAGNIGTSTPVTFTVDTTPPAISITSPGDISTAHVSRPTFSGLAGHASGDEQSITLKIYEGSDVSGSPLQTVEHIVPSGGKWTTGANGPVLANGTYTALAEQSDEAGNIASATTTFKVETDSPVVTLQTRDLVQRESGPVTGPTPSFSGTAGSEAEDAASVVVMIYRGASTSGTPVETVNAPVADSSWTTPAAGALPDGTYTAQAEQQDSDAQAGVSDASTFTVDADPPLVTLSTPTDGSSTASSTQSLTGAAGTAEGDLSTITVALYEGSTVLNQTPLETLTVQASGGSWSAAFGALSPGTYTAQAEQRDDVSNDGHSAPVTFTLIASAQSTPPTVTQESAPTPSSPPVASFTWFPAAPHTGEPVSLVSTSTDTKSPITAFAWDLAGDGAFGAGGPSLSTSFATPGAHVVHLRVTSTDGLSSVVAETINVTSPTVPLMQPFPVVRMAGSEYSFGVKVSLLTVQAPTGARITVSCHGPGCPARTAHVVATSPGGKSRAGLVTVTFGRFERSLRAGASLQIRVSEPGVIGKYTRFVVRRGRLPLRTDSCLSPNGSQAIACPVS
jgi:hypothetical protein